MMTKNDVRTFGDLAEFASVRATGSLRRNDPWAMAYWKETEKFAKGMLKLGGGIPDWAHAASLAARRATLESKAGNDIESALCYSRAKWFVIMGRNNGVVMNPKITGVNHSVFEEMPE